MSNEPADESARAAVRGGLGALLVDADVAAVHAVEGGAVEVTRRGRRERLGVALPSEVFEALAALGARDGEVALDVDGHTVRALPVAGERVLVYLDKRPAGDAKLPDLVEEGALSEDAAAAVVSAARAGNGLVVVGTPRAATRRFAIAVARELADSAPVMALDDGVDASWLVPAPRVEGDVVARARACERAGAEVLLAPSLSLEGARALANAALSTSVVVAVRAPSAAAFAAAFRRGQGEGALSDALASQLCVLGRAPGGRPVLVEQHLPAGAPIAPPAPVDAPPRPLIPAPAVEVPERSHAPPRAPAPPAVVVDADPLPPLPPLGAGPPEGWASSAPDDDPGWELGEPKQGPSPFDDVLAQVKARPTFTPRPPPVHPQTRALRGDPFGGLTLEPPGGAVDDDGEDGTTRDEDER